MVSLWDCLSYSVYVKSVILPISAKGRTAHGRQYMQSELRCHLLQFLVLSPMAVIEVKSVRGARAYPVNADTH